jgi:hypothetical protein
MKKTTKSARILFCLEPRLKSAFQKYCKSKGLTMTDVIDKNIRQVTKFKWENFAFNTRAPSARSYCSCPNNCYQCRYAGCRWYYSHKHWRSFCWNGCTLTGTNYTWGYSKPTSASQTIDTFLNISSTNIAYRFFLALVQTNPILQKGVLTLVLYHLYYKRGI